ncbi:hypothetical protein, partial [Massilia sp. CCM 8734]|uniref:hypothetical protein n=1 Tax=Massilia sp. CCM 8734 TaxID=2609283 RepID=UPI001AAFD466
EDQYVPVSTTASPVTHTAETEVKSAVRKGADPGASRAKGIIRSKVPMMIVVRKASATMRAG